MCAMGGGGPFSPLLAMQMVLCKWHHGIRPFVYFFLICLFFEKEKKCLLQASARHQVLEPGANPDSHGCLYIGQPWLPLIITLFERLLAFMKGSNKSWAMDITNEHVKNVQISTNLMSLKSLKQINGF